VAQLLAPFCITVDFDTLNDKAVTIRHRDSTNQERFNPAELIEHLINLIPQSPRYPLSIPTF